MPILIKTDDVKSGRKAKVRHGRLRAAQESMGEPFLSLNNTPMNSKSSMATYVIVAFSSWPEIVWCFILTEAPLCLKKTNHYMNLENSPRLVKNLVSLTRWRRRTSTAFLVLPNFHSCF